MLATTLRGMVAHKLRLVLTTMSIALGVAFLAGTLILSDTMKLAFDQLFGKVSSGTDAVVRAEAAYSQTDGVGVVRRPIPQTVLDTVRTVDGVRAAEGAVSGYALMTDTSGKAVLAKGGAPTRGYNLPADTTLRGDVAIRTGRAPSGAGEVAIDATSAESHGIALGSRIRILFQGPAQAFTVVGTVGFGGEKDLGGTTAAYFDTATAQRVLGTPGMFDQIDVSAVAGVEDAELARRLDAAMSPGLESVTGATVAQEASDAIKGNLGFFTIMLMVFAGIALFVGSFIIWNTFTMIVAQRSREIALLRAVGATRRQVMRSLVVEALLLGFGASALGLGLGVAVARGLTALMDAVGLSLPTTSMQLAPRTIWLSLLVGTLVTVVAALAPARRATKVLPVEALRDAAPGLSAPSRKRAVAGVVVTGVGTAALFAGLFSGAGFALVGLGLVATLLGVTTLAPLAARPLAALIGSPLRLRGVPGELAQQNAMRNPRRTASTAAALMIGLTMVVGMGVFAASLKASFGSALTESTKADLFVSPASFQSGGFSPEASKAAAEVPGVRTVSPTGWGQARIAGGSATFSSVDPATVEDALILDVSSGRARDLGTDGLLVGRSTADGHGWKVGDTVPVEFPATGTKQFRVAGIFDRKGFIDTPYVMSLAAHETFGGARLDSRALVVLEDGADKGAVQQSLAAALAGYPDAKVLDGKGFEKEAAGFVDQLLGFVTVMLLLAVVIALLGIVNTLALSVFERTRELGLLRAVGMTGAQVRAMVRWEAVIISLIGSVAGAALGTALGVAMTKALEDQGMGSIAVPGPQIMVYVALAALAGLLAAVGPARRAAKVDVLRAVVTD